MEWLESFKVALLEEDEKQLASLIEGMPERFDDLQGIETAMALILQAKSLIETKQRQLGQEMRELERAKRFLTSSPPAENGKLDITS